MSTARALIVLAALVTTVGLVAAPARAAESPDFPARIRDASTRYPEESARLAVGGAFLDFESSTLHGDVAARDQTLYRDLETRWLALAAAMKSGAAPAEVRAQGEALARLLEAAAGTARPAGAASLFLDALVIIVREGFEAILILTALAAYLVKVGLGGQRWLVYGGAAAAVATSVALAVLASVIVPMTGAAREALEGVTMLLAVVVLFTASYWLISKAEARRWQAYVRAKLEGALSSRRRAALFVLAFLVVFREGFETVLFYEALAGRAAGVPLALSAVGTGLAVGLVLLAAIAVALFRYGVRIPVGPFFAVTGGLLYVLAFKFAGAGIRELQEAGLVSATPVGLPDMPLLRDWLAVYPYLEPLAAQAVLLAALLGGAVHVLATSSRRGLRVREAVRS